MLRQISVTIVISFALISTAAVAPAYGQFKVVYNFGSGGNLDPCEPQNAGIIAQGEDGYLYTSAPNCGAHDGGSAIRVTPSGTFRDIHDFSGGDGASPFGGLTLHPVSGNFYGTTQGGGTAGDGTLFAITTGGTVGVLHSFTGGSDGYTVDAPPIIGLDGNLYGTARRGGNFVACGGTGCGVVYKMTPSGALIWSYKFDITHGLYPYAPLIQGTDGNFYGTTQEGGTSGGLGGGVVFKIAPSGTLTVLHNFCSKAGCEDGQYPFSPLIQGADGNFYGTTVNGGANEVGEVFKITPAGALTVLHSMNSATDGQNPYGGLVLASDGNFYGTNQLGGTHNGGTIFKITPTGVFTVLYNFDGTTGAQPMVTLVQHTNGTLYGNTFQGGTGAEVNCTLGTCGVFFKYNAPALKPFIKLVPASGYVGSQIGILGQGFTASSVVKFNGIKATIVSHSSTFLMAKVPSGTLDGYVTVTTGTTTLKSVEEFAVHNSWGSGKPMPTARAGGAIGVINGKIYVVSGETNNNIVANNEIYNPATNSWTTGAPIPTPRYVPASAVVNGILYVMGGITDASQTPSNLVESYNPATNTWSTKASMPTPDDSVNAVVENGLIYVVGGFTSGARSAVVQRYNPATNTWRSEAPLLVAKSSSVLGVLGTTIVSSGGLENTNNPSGDTEGYDAATNEWSALTADPTPRNGGCGAAISGQLYVTGGSDSGFSGNATAVTESYNLSKNDWTTLLPAPLAVIVAPSAVVNNQLYCLGGTDNGVLFQGNIYNNVQIYQP